MPIRRARELRREMTVPERVVWQALRDRRLAGWRFRRQAAIGPYIVDFYCHAARLVLEIDGLSHVGRGDEDASARNGSGVAGSISSGSITTKSSANSGP
jgi:very-short-patch-repair endonuclease